MAWLVAEKNVKKGLPVRDYKLGLVIKLEPRFGSLAFLEPRCLPCSMRAA